MKNLPGKMIQEHKSENDKSVQHYCGSKKLKYVMELLYTKTLKLYTTRLLLVFSSSEVIL